MARKSPGLARVVRGREPPPSRILDFMFLGNVLDAKNSAFRKENNITTIINVSTEQYWLDDNTIDVHSFAAVDSSTYDIRPLFPKTNEILDAARRRYFAETDPCRRQRVLVHCQKGRSRSATIVLAYLIRANGWTVHQALAFVAQRRETVEPNLGFFEALREYQCSFSEDERRPLLVRLCLKLRGVDAEVSDETVARFFEERFGAVAEVRWWGQRVAPAATSSEAEAGNHPLQQSSDGAPTACHRTSSSGSSEGPTEVAAERRRSAAATGEAPSQSTMVRGDPAAQPRPITLVFFAMAESVRAAHMAFKRHRELFAPLVSDLKHLRILPVKTSVPAARLLGPRENVATLQTLQDKSSASDKEHEINDE
jgi:dual specificity phosphatase 12